MGTAFKEEVVDGLRNLNMVRFYIAISTLVGIHLTYSLEVEIEREMPCPNLHDGAGLVPCKHKKFLPEFVEREVGVYPGEPLFPGRVVPDS